MKNCEYISKSQIGSELSTLVARVEKLESCNNRLKFSSRRWMVATWLLGSFLFAFAIMGAGRSGSADADVVIQAGTFEVIDADGNVRIRLGYEEAYDQCFALFMDDREIARLQASYTGSLDSSNIMMMSPGGRQNIDLFSAPVSNGITVFEAGGGDISAELWSDTGGKGLTFFDGSRANNKITMIYREELGPYIYLTGDEGTQAYISVDNPTSGMSEISLMQGIGGSDETGTRLFYMDDYWGTAVMEDGVIRGMWSIEDRGDTSLYLDNYDGARLLLMNDEDYGPAVILGDEDGDLVWDAP